MAEAIQIKTNHAVISEYETRLAEFTRKFKILVKRNRTLARHVYLRAYCFGALEYPEIPQKNDVNDYQPKRGKKQRKTFPIKLVQEALKCSHRQAIIYHLAGLLEEEIWDLAALHEKEAMLWKAQQQEAVSNGQKC